MILGQYHVTTNRIHLNYVGSMLGQHCSTPVHQHCFDVDKRRFFLKSYMCTTGCALGGVRLPDFFLGI